MKKAALAILPLIGFISDSRSIYVALLVLGGLIILNQLFFSIENLAQRFSWG